MKFSMYYGEFSNGESIFSDPSKGDRVIPQFGERPCAGTPKVFALSLRPSSLVRTVLCSVIKFGFNESILHLVSDKWFIL